MISVNLKKVLLAPLAFSAMFLTPQSYADTAAEVKKLQQELLAIKALQVKIARQVGLGAEVRPTSISLLNGQNKGNEKAKVAIIEFTDLHCPFCARFNAEVMPELKSRFIDKGLVYFVGKDLPLNEIHPNAGYAAVMLRCAANLGQYDKARDDLFLSARTFDNDYVNNFAKKLKLDDTKFMACIQDQETHANVSDSLKEAYELGIKSTPTFIVGRKDGDMVTDYEVISGVLSLERLQGIIDNMNRK